MGDTEGGTRVSVGRWCCAVPLGLLGLYFAASSLFSIAVIGWLLVGQTAEARSSLASAIGGQWLMLAAITVGQLLAGLALIAGAWLLVQPTGRRG